MMHKACRSIEEVPYCFSSHPSNFTVTRAEKLMIWIQFEIAWPIAAIKYLRFVLLFFKNDNKIDNHQILYWAIHTICMGNISDNIWRYSCILRLEQVRFHQLEYDDDLHAPVLFRMSNFILGFDFWYIFVIDMCFAILVINWPDMMGPINLITPLRDS